MHDRDIRLDLFRGLANWAIFVDHIPNNVVAWITTKNYGFSDAADLFVFISGYTAALAYLSIMSRDGFWVGTIRLMGRVWQLYVAHILLFVVYIAAIGWVVQTYRDSHLLDEFNVAGLMADPASYLAQGLLLKFKPLNMDVLPLYIVLMASFPIILRTLMRFPTITLVISFVIYLATGHLGWNLPAWPTGGWYFNPFAWQFLFVFGAWCAIGGARLIQRFASSALVIGMAVSYLLFAFLVMILAHLDLASQVLPSWLADWATANDKTNLAPYRFLHLLALAVVVTSMISRDRSWLRSVILTPALLCGRFSLEVFCVGIFLSFIAHFALELISEAVPMQILVSVIGIAIMTAVAWTKSLRLLSKTDLPEPAVRRSN